MQPTPTEDRFGGGGGGMCELIITGLIDHPASLQAKDQQPNNDVAQEYARSPGSNNKQPTPFC